ncbi:hypothetical protein K437DRAFT_294747 [Tilletiaria anomala UBC 951]|uniref:FAD/NAD(P)-binding domain-containing protein n=1 Tax=Tilletiaria anomala (strain ATCC 24038 / CBS 436.72 / UBC 951) TaxID=1037660 RepID=A0A066VWS3_TILAU|nr:uncharacterized protein K437DRAFT_294747 [Tilletiaria anomala UBC 951]KDN44738.1 hypothetical protein K437DRAFT_294747 [Tilletiaria anomala UBC 951]
MVNPVLPEPGEAAQPQPTPPLPVSRPDSVLVLGGGVAGLVTLRNFLKPDLSSSSSHSTSEATGENGRDRQEHGQGLQRKGEPFEHVELWERRDQLGGVWYLDEQVASHEKSVTPYATQGQWPVPVPISASAPDSGQATTSKSISVSNTTPSSLQPQAHPHRPTWPSPAYPQLRGNVLPRFLSYSCAKPFPPPANGEPFPTLAETHAYLLGFAREHGLLGDGSGDATGGRIKTGREVLGAWELPPTRHENESAAAGGPHPKWRSAGWLVLSRQWPTGASAQADAPLEPTLHIDHFSHLALCTGWYDYPIYTSRVPGFEEAKARGFVHHAKWYRGPDAYCSRSGMNTASPTPLGGIATSGVNGTNGFSHVHTREKRIVIVGNGNSANDIAAHIAQMYPDPGHSVSGNRTGKDQPTADAAAAAVPRVYRSIKHKALDIFVNLPDPRIKDVAPIKAYHLREHSDAARRGDATGGTGTDTLDLELEDGTFLRNVDTVILGTGYDGFRYPFVHLLSPSRSAGTELHLQKCDTIRKRAAELVDASRDDVQRAWAHFVQQVSERGILADYAASAGGANAPRTARELQHLLWAEPLDGGDAAVGAFWAPMEQTSSPTFAEPAAARPNGADGSAASHTPSPTGHNPTWAGEDAVTWTPPRVGGLYRHCLLARNPSLACIGLSVSFTPFTSTDTYSWLVRSIWDGSSDAFPDFEAGDGDGKALLRARLQDETHRISLLRERERDVVALERDSFARWKADGCPQRPLEHVPSGLLAYHVFGTDEAAWMRQIRNDVVIAKPWLDLELDDWTAENREKVRLGMYRIKWESLVKARERRLAESKASGSTIAQ